MGQARNFKEDAKHWGVHGLESCSGELEQKVVFQKEND